MFPPLSSRPRPATPSPSSFLSLPYELQSQIHSSLPLSAQLSLASTCRALRHRTSTFPPTHGPLSSSPTARFELFCMGERDGQTSNRLACHACRRTHTPGFFKHTDHALGLRDRKCIGAIDHLAVHPNWALTFAEMGELLASRGAVLQRPWSRLAIRDWPGDRRHRPFHNRQKLAGGEQAAVQAEEEAGVPPLLMWCEGATVRRHARDEMVEFVTQYHYPARSLFVPDVCDGLENVLGRAEMPAARPSRYAVNVPVCPTLVRARYFGAIMGNVAAGLQRLRVDYPLCPHLHLSDLVEAHAELKLDGTKQFNRRCSICESSCALHLHRSVGAKVQEFEAIPAAEDGSDGAEQGTGGNIGSGGATNMQGQMGQMSLGAGTGAGQGGQANINSFSAGPMGQAGTQAVPGAAAGTSTGAGAGTNGPTGAVTAPCITTNSKGIPAEQLGNFTFTFTLKREVGNMKDPTNAQWLHQIIPPDAVQPTFSKDRSKKEYVL